MEMVTLQNRHNQAIKTLVLDAVSDKFVEVTLSPRGTLDVPEKLSSLTESQVREGVLKVKTTKAVRVPESADVGGASSKQEGDE